VAVDIPVRLDGFQGLGRLTTWAYKLVIFAVSNKVTRWRRPATHSATRRPHERRRLRRGLPDHGPVRRALTTALLAPAPAIAALRIRVGRVPVTVGCPA
jgi:hypothetical protein